MAKFITACIEMETDNTIHLGELISTNEIPGKKDILNYLKNGQDNGVCCSSVYDYIDDYYTGDTIHRYKDEEYEWDDREIYHFEKYNLKLNDDFVDYLKKKIGA